MVQHVAENPYVFIEEGCIPHPSFFRVRPLIYLKNLKIFQISKRYKVGDSFVPFEVKMAAAL